MPRAKALQPCDMSDLGPHTFDARRAITVDLQAGQIHVASSPRVLVPTDALVALCSAAGEAATVEFGRALGEAMGERVRGRFHSEGALVADVPEADAPGSSQEGSLRAVRAAPFPVIIEQLAGELALAGLGALSAERWGKVLVLVVLRSPVATEAIGDVFLCGVLGAALSASTGAAASVVPVAREEARPLGALPESGALTRFLVLREAAVDGVLTALEAGATWGELVEGLNGGVS